MNKVVAVLMGGTSSERDVSLNSGRACSYAIKEAGYNVIDIDIKAQDHDTIRRQLTPAPDVVFNALHGTFGEDGKIQKILNNLNIPYTHSGYTTSKLAMDKPRTIELYKQNNIPVAKSIRINANDFNEKKLPFPRPFVIKPACEGSSVGLFIIFEDNNLPDLSDWQWGDIMVEQYIYGLELTVSVLNGNALTVTELKPDSGIYDYESKYSNGKTQHICPANIDKKLFNNLLRWSESAHKALKCRGISRTDFRYDHIKNIVATLETNTQPGMTELSLVPEQAKNVGILLPNLVKQLVELATMDKD